MNRHGSLNRIYRLVWSQVTNSWVAVAENTRGRGKGGRGTRKLVAAALSLTAVTFAMPPAMAGPTGGQVVSGTGTIAQSGNTTTITQATQNLSLNWNTFNVAPQETVNFVQPSSSAIAVNRIFDTNGSQILGNINANGQVYLINPNGILFGQGAQVNVGGLVASTLDYNDSTSSSTTKSFSGSGSGSVVNQGKINANGGYVALLGNSVSNQGTITAQLGTVALGAGNAVTLTFAGDKLVHLQVDQSVLNSLAENGGLIQADGGMVVMSAGAADSLLASVVNNTGIIQAQTVNQQGGTITLLSGMAAGTTNVGGTLDASAPGSGNGGTIETSGHQLSVADAAVVTTAAANGLAGSWLLDPYDFTIGSDISEANLESALSHGNVTIQTNTTPNGCTTAVTGCSSDPGYGIGDINVEAPVTWSANRLTLTAAYGINIDAVMTASGTAGLTMTTGAGSTDLVAIGSTGFYGKVNFSNTASGALVINGNAYTLINSYSALQTLLAAGDIPFENYYALGSDFTASGTNATPNLSGTLDGLGHVITGLTNNPGTTNSSLFAAVENVGVVQNLGLAGVNVTATTGSAVFGGLAQTSSGTINNSYASGTVSASGTLDGYLVIGGLIGANFSTGKINNSYSSVNVNVAGTVASGNVIVGGLVGANYGGTINSGQVSGSVSITGSVSGNSYVGGLVGLNKGQISGSSSMSMSMSGSVGGNSYVGGLVGVNYGTGTIGSSAASGNVSISGSVGRASYIGGLVGQNVGTISNSQASGSVGMNGSVTGSSYVGGLVGKSSGTINEYSSASGTVSAGGTVGSNSYVGGLVGVNGDTIDTSYASGSVSAGGTVSRKSYVGGLVGVNGDTISNSYASGNVTMSGSVAYYSVVGGLAGKSSGTINNSYASGSVTASGSEGNSIYVGGLVGFNYGTISSSYVSGSVSTGGSVSGNSYVGGLVGVNSGTISNSYATGTVSAGGTVGSNSYVGGLVGDNGNIINNSYAVGSVSTGGSVNSYVGGLAGESRGTISSSFWNSTIGGATGVGVGTATGATGMNTADMMTETTFTSAGWSFPDTATGTAAGTWILYEGQTYPLLRAFMTPVTVSVDTGKTYDGTAFTGGGSFMILTCATTYSFDCSGDSNINTQHAVYNYAYVDGSPTNSTQAGTYSDLTVSGFSSGQQGYIINYVGSYNVVSIAQRILTGSVANVSSVYGATVTPGAVTLTTGVLASDVGNVTVTPVVNNQTLSTSGNVNAGTYAESVTLSGSAAGNYTTMNGDTNEVAGTYTVTKLALVGAITAGGSVYGAALTPGSFTGLTGVLGSGETADQVTAAVTVNTAGNLSGGSNLKAGSYTGIETLHLSGDDANNYSTADITGNYTVTKLALAVSGTSVAANKTYDGTTTAALSGGSVAAGVLEGDSVTLTQAGTFASANAAAGIAVTANDSLSGADAGNYTLTQPAGSLTATINQLLLTATIASVSTTYGTAAPTGLVTFTNLPEAGSTPTATATLVGVTTSTSGNTNAGSYHEIVTSLASNPNGNYVLPEGGIGNGSYVVTPKALSGSIPNPGSVYGAELTPGNATLSGVVAGDSVTAPVTVTGESFSSSGNVKAGTYAATAGGDSESALSGKDAGDYTLPTVTGHYTVAQASLTVSGASASSKVYDGSTAATVTGGSLSGLVSGTEATDQVSLSLSGGTFASANVGSSVAVNTTASIGGADAANYTVSAPSLAAAITPAPLSIVGETAGSKVYNGNTTATLTGGTLSGLVGSDSVTLTQVGTFATANVGSNIAVTASDSIGGSAAGNYTLTGQPSGLSANITPAPLSIVGETASSKVYNGNTTATLSGGMLAGVVGSDSVTLTQAGTFATANAGSNIAVTASDSIGGSAAGNYTLTGQPSGLSASITPAPLTVVGETAATKVYDGSTAATLSGGTLSGLVAGDTVSLTQAGAFASANVGNSVAVTTADAIAGAAAGNYTLAQPTVTGSITPVTLTYTAVAQTAVGGSTPTGMNGTVSGFVNGESQATATSGTLAWTTPATAASTPGQYAIDGSGLGATNYVFTQAAANATALTMQAAPIQTSVASLAIQPSTQPVLTGGVTTSAPALQPSVSVGGSQGTVVVVSDAGTTAPVTSTTATTATAPNAGDPTTPLASAASGNATPDGTTAATPGTVITSSSGTASGGSGGSSSGVVVNTTITIVPGLALQVVSGGIRLPDNLANVNE